MADVRVEINESEFNRLMGVHGEAGDYLRRVIAPVVVAEQRAHAAVDTGRMRDSCQLLLIHPTSVGLGCDVGPTARSDDGTYYPWFVEFGTRHMAAQPFIRRSVSVIGRR